MPTPLVPDTLSSEPWIVVDEVVVVVGSVVSHSVEARHASMLLPGTLLFFLWTSCRSDDSCAEPAFLLRTATGPPIPVERGGVTDCGTRDEDGRRDSTPVVVGAVATAVVEGFAGRLLMTFGCRLPPPL